MALRFSRVTRTAVRGLQPGDKLHEHGITVEKQVNGDVRYSVNVMVDGQRVHRVVGRESEGVTREQAERYIEKVRTEAREDRLDLPKGRKAHRTLAKAGPEYLTKMEQSGGKDLVNKRRHLNMHLIPALGRERIDKLTNFRLKLYRKSRLEQGASEATVNRELATLLHLLNRAASKDWNWIKADAVPEIPRAAEERKQIRILTPDQDERLLNAALADHDPDIWLFCLFALNASMRHTEIMRRRFDEMDYESCRIWIDRAKAGARSQPITPTLRDAIRSRQEAADDPDGWIFPARKKGGKRPHRGFMSKPFIRVVKAAGLDPSQCTPHVLRHTAISRLVMNKTDVPTIQKISGHKTAAMVFHYTHVFGDHINEAMRVLDTKKSDVVTHGLHAATDQEVNARTPLRVIKGSNSAT